MSILERLQLKSSLYGFRLKKKTNQGAANYTSDQSGKSQDGVLKTL